MTTWTYRVDPSPLAYDDFRVVRDNLHGGARTTRDRVIPFCMFTDPELARVGLNESEANKRGVAYRLAKLPMTAVLRAVTLGETAGLLKMLIDTHSLVSLLSNVPPPSP